MTLAGRPLLHDGLRVGPAGRRARRAGARPPRRRRRLACSGCARSARRTRSTSRGRARCCAPPAARWRRSRRARGDLEGVARHGDGDHRRAGRRRLGGLDRRRRSPPPPPRRRSHRDPALRHPERVLAVAARGRARRARCRLPLRQPAARALVVDHSSSTTARASAASSSTTAGASTSPTSAACTCASWTTPPAAGARRRAHSPARRASRAFHDIVGQSAVHAGARRQSLRRDGLELLQAVSGPAHRRTRLRGPETLVTNDPDLVRAFVAEHGRAIYKSISSERSNEVLDHDNLARLDAIRWCPVQFQAFVEGYDVRVHTVGGQVFATRITSAATDYRYARLQTGAAAEMEPCELEPELADRDVRSRPGVPRARRGSTSGVHAVRGGRLLRGQPEPRVLVLRSAHRPADGRRDHLLPRGRRFVILLGDDARRIAGAILATLVLVAALPSGAATAASIPLPGPTVTDPLEALVTPGDTMRLSDELKVSRWANANTRNPIRTAPESGAPTITRLRYVTEDKLPEVYLVLSARADARADVWVKVRIPMQPDGRTGWVRADNLSQLYVVRTRLVINRSTTRATLYQKRQPHLAGAGRRRQGLDAHAGRQVLRPRAAQGRRQALRDVGVRHKRLREHLRLAQRGRRRRPRHRPAGARPGPPVARLRARAQRQHQPAPVR